jgi:hypothetical protein
MGNTPRRSIRIPDFIWKPIERLAKGRGVSPSHEVRSALLSWLRRHRDK